MLSDGVSFCENCGASVPQINVRQEAARQDSASRRTGNDGANRERTQGNAAPRRPRNDKLNHGRMPENSAARRPQSGSASCEGMPENNGAYRPQSGSASREGMPEGNVPRSRRQTEPEWMRDSAGDAGTARVPRRPAPYRDADDAGTTAIPRRSDARRNAEDTRTTETQRRPAPYRDTEDAGTTAIPRRPDARRGANAGAAPRRPAPYGTPNDVLRRQAGIERPYPADLPQDEAYDVRRRTRYRQEELGGDWQESWEREYSDEVEEQRFTPVQYVLIGLMVLLLIALIAFGIYWIIGRNTDRSSRQPGAGVTQTDGEQTQQADGGAQPDITILDDTANKPQDGAGQNAAGAGQTGANQNGTGQAGTNQNAAGQDNADQNAAGQTNVNQSAAGQTSANQNAAGQTSTNQNAAGQTSTNQNGAGQTSTNQNGAGQTGANQAGTGQNGTSQSGTVQSETTPQTQAIEIQNNTTAAHAGDYLPESSTRLMTDADVAGMSYEDMQMAINEIYARHGRIFETPEIRDHFAAQPWYNGTVSQQDFNESVFSSVEAQNIQFLVEKMGD